MKIKQTLLVLTLLFGSVVFMATPTPTHAASCGGVETSLINCENKGNCKDGSNPYEGVNPRGDLDKENEYISTYGHHYGKCLDGADPTQEVTDTGIWGILMIAINILTAGVGILAVGGIVYGSVLYTSAGGNAEQVKKAMTIFTNVVIGIVAYAAMYAFLNFIIPGGIFN